MIALSILLLASPAGAYFAYVPSFNTSTVTVIDTANDSIVTQLTVGSGATDTAVTPDGTLALVVSNLSGSVSAIDTGSNKVISNISVTGTGFSEPSSVVITTDSKRAFIIGRYAFIVLDLTKINDSNAAVMFRSSPIVSLGRNPATLSPDGKKIYVPTDPSGPINIIDVTTFSTSSLAIPPTGNGFFVQVSPDNTKLLVSAQSTVKNMSTSGSLLSSFITGTFINTIAVIPNDARKAFISAKNSSNLQGIFVATFPFSTSGTVTLNTFINTGFLSTQRWGFTPDGNKLYCGGNLTVIDTQANTILKTFPTLPISRGISVQQRTPLPDTTQPSTINDLTATIVGSLVRLNWTAPSDTRNSLSGPIPSLVTSYEIRYATFPLILGSTFESGYKVPDPPLSAVPGTPHQFFLRGLPAGKPVYFAIKAFDGAGNFSVTPNVSATPSTTFAPGIITTYAGKGGIAGFSGDGGLSSTATLNYSYGVAVDNTGNVYIADSANCRIRKVDSQGIITTVAGTGSCGFSGDGGRATNASINIANDVAVDNQGNIFIADTTNYRIRKVDIWGAITTLLTMDLQPTGVAVDRLGNLYIADQSALRKLTPTGILTTLSTGTITDAAADQMGNIYFTNKTLNKIFKINPIGQVIFVAGSGVKSFSGDGGLASTATFSSPSGVAVCGQDLYISDYDNARIRKINLTSNIVTTFAGNGTRGFSGDGSPASSTSTRIGSPLHIETDTEGNLYTAELTNHVIRAIGNPDEQTTADTPPAQITDISMLDVTSSTFRLRWTATGDNDMTGDITGGAYSIRIATIPISAANFDSIQNIPPISFRVTFATNVAAGAQESRYFTGLLSDQVYFAALKLSDGAGNQSPLSTIASTKTIDAIAPSSTTLSVVAVTSSTIRLAWTAPGDNGNAGDLIPPAKFIIRYALSPFTTAQFDSAPFVVQIQTTAVAGTAQSFTITELADQTQFFLALKTADDAGNLSAASNIASTTTAMLDILPPSPINDLAATTGRLRGEIDLAWSAVGDNGLIGNATSYILKYSIDPIADQAAFDAAQTAAQNIVPGIPGTHEHFTLVGLAPGQQYYVAVEAVDKVGNKGGLSNAASANAQADIPPSQIADLAVSAPSSSSVLLTWTAVGEDAAIGQATSYDLRYSLTPITEATFPSATGILSPPAPRISGSQETFIAEGLPPRTQLYFAVKAIDAAGHASPISNVVQAATVGDPSLAAFVFPPQAIVAGQTATLMVRVTDDVGNPVPRVQVQFSLTRGTAGLGSTAATGTDGIAQTSFVAPATNEIDTVRAQVAGFSPIQTDILVLIAALENIEGFPTTPLVFDAGEHTISSSALAFQWMSQDPYSPITDNFISIGSQGDRNLGGWVETAAPPGSYRGFLAYHNGYIYAFSTETGWKARFAHIASDGSLEPWQPVSAPPNGAHTGFIFQNTIYAFTYGGEGYKAQIESTSGQITSWQPVSPMFLGLNTDFDMAVVGDYAFLIGGSDPFVYSAKLNADGTIPAQGQPGFWTKTVPLPSPLGADPRACVINGDIYVMGSGRTVYKASPTNYGTIPPKGWGSSWSPMTALPFPKYAPGVAIDNNTLYVIGGDEGSRVSSVLRATPQFGIPPIGENGSWQLSTFLQSYPFKGRAVVAQNRIYHWNISQGASNFWFTEIHPNGNVGAWHRLPNHGSYGRKPTKAREFGWTSLPTSGGSSAFILGGIPSDASVPVADVYRAALKTPFKVLAPPGIPGDKESDIYWDYDYRDALPIALEGMTVVSSEGRLYVLGGRNSAGSANATIYTAIASQVPLAWTTAGTLPSLNSNGTLQAVILNGRLYTMGTSSNEVYVAPIGENGVIGSFIQTTSIPNPPAAIAPATSSAITYRGRIYLLIGGTAYSAAPGVDGLITQWRQEQNIPDSLHAGLSASDETLYAIGGAGQSQSLAVYASHIGSDGLLNAWAAIGNMPEIRNTGVAVLHDDKILTFGPRLNQGTPGLFGTTGDFYEDTLIAPIHLSGNDALERSVGANSDLAATELSLVRGQDYYASVRTKNAAGVWSRLGTSNGIRIDPPSTPADILAPRSTLTIGQPAAGIDPTLITPQTPLSFASIDDRTTIGDASGEGVQSLVVALDDIVISTNFGAVIRISTEGMHVLSYYAVDKIGNAEEARFIGIVVDNSPPQTQILSPGALAVISGTYTLVEGASGDSISAPEKILVRAGESGAFSTATLLGTTQEGLTLWNCQVPIGRMTSTLSIEAHSLDLMGNYDAKGSSVTVLVFNVIDSTMAVFAAPSVASPGSLVLIKALVLSQLGGPLQGAEVEFSATLKKTWDVGGPSDSVGLPPVSFKPSLALTDSSGVAVTTLAVGGWDGYFTEMAEHFAVQEFWRQAAPLVGQPPYSCPAYFFKINDTLNWLFQEGINNGTITSQNQAAVLAQMQTIAQEQMTAASQALFERSLGLITVTARLLPRSSLPELLEKSAKTNLLSIPYAVSLTGLPTNDSGEQPNAVTYGDSNSNSAPALPGTSQNSYGTIYRVAGFGFDIPNILPNVDILPSIPISDSLFNSVDQASKLFMNSQINSIPGGKWIAYGMAWGVDMMGDGHSSREQLQSMIGSSGGSLNLSDLATLGIIPGDWTSYLPPGMSVGLDLSGSFDKPQVNWSAGYSVDGLNAGYSSRSGLNAGYSIDGLNLGYSALGGFDWSFAQSFDGLQVNLNSAGFSSSLDLVGLLGDQPLGKTAIDYGLNSMRVGLISGDYSGRLNLNVSDVKVGFDSGKFLKTVGEDLKNERFSFGNFGSLFRNMSGWSSGLLSSFRGASLPFRSSALFGNLGLGSLAVKTPTLSGALSGLPDPIASFRPQDPQLLTQSGGICRAEPTATDPLQVLSPNAFKQYTSFSAPSLVSGNYNGVKTVAGVTASPINTSNGNLFYSVEDALIPGRALFLQLVRTYNSLDFGSGPFGQGWSFNYGMSVEPGPQAGSLVVRWGDGGTRAFIPNGDGSFRGPPGTFTRMSTEVGGGYTLTQKQGTRYLFNANGRLSSIVDKNGNTVQLAYNGGNLSSITDPSGRALNFSHDAQGRIASMTDPAGHVTSYTYDPAGNLVHVSAPGYEASYSYDANHGLLSYNDPRSQTGYPSGSVVYNDFRQVVTEKDSAGNTVAALSLTLGVDKVESVVTDVKGSQTTDRYGLDGLWTGRTDPLGGVTQLVFDSSANLKQVSEADGSTAHWSFDEKGNKTGFTDAAGAAYSFTLDSNGRPLSAGLPNGGTILLGYDAKGNLASWTDAENNASAFTYDAAGNIVSYTDARGKTTSMDYDAAGNRVRLERPGGAAKTYAYDSLGRIASETDENGKTTTIERLASGHVSKITYPLGETSQFEYDANGRLNREIDPLGNAVSYVRDARGFVTQATDALGASVSIEYDAAGLPTRLTDARGSVHETSYDALNRPIRQSDPAGANSIAYDAVGHPTTLTDPLGNVLHISRDALGRPTRLESPEGGVTQLSYDPMGNLTSRTDPSGGVSQYLYDKTGLPTRVTDPLGRSVSMEYDASGKPVKITDPNGNAATYEYDANGLLAAKTDAAGRKTSFSVDPMGRLLSVTDPLQHTTQLSYDWSGKLLSLTRPDGAVASFTYDAAGNRISATDALGNTTHFEFDAAGRPTRLINADGKATSLAYDLGGKPVSITLPDGAAYHMAYDPAGRLTNFTTPAGSARGFEYDANGNTVAETDPLGDRWTYSYNANGRLTRVTDPLGDTASYAYDANGNIASHTGPRGALTRFAYDSADQLTVVTDPLNGLTKFVYDPAGNMLSVEDPLGRKTSYSYDTVNQIASITDAAQQARTFAYDSLGRLVSATGPLGEVTRYEYEAGGRISKLTDPMGAVTSFLYNLIGARTQRTEPSGEVLTYEYDSLNRLIALTRPSGTVRFTYDSRGRMLTDTAADGSVTQYTYDADGRRLSRTDPLGSVTHYTYDANGNRLTLTDAAGNVTRFEYDALNRLTRLQMPDGSASHFAYDASNNQTSITDPAGSVTSFIFDLLNRMQSQTDPAGASTSFEYDAVGNQTKITDTAGKSTSFTYDVLNRVLNAVDPAGGITSYVYNALGNLLTTTDPSGAMTHSEFDLSGRVTASIDPAGARTEYTYDAAGRLIGTKDALGHTASNTYDNKGRLTETTDALGRTTRYTYDTAGNRTTFTDAANNISRYEYDANGRLTATVDPLQDRTAYKYDAVGNKTEQTDPEGHVTRFEYGTDNRLSAVVDALGNRRAFTYDAGGRKISETAPDGAISRYEYDNNGRLTATVDPLGNRLTQAYDSRGNLLSKTDAKGNATRYAYDDLGRLVQVTDAENGIWGYSYDASGRLLKIVDANRHDAVLFAYDSAGRLLSQTDALGNATRFEYDALGNRTKLIKPNNEELRYEYDAGNRLTIIKGQSGAVLATLGWDVLDQMTSMSAPDISANYVYDAAGRLTQLQYPTLNKTLSFSFDRDGLRKTLSVGGEQSSYNYDAGHRLTSMIAPVSRGGQTSEGTYSFSYDAAGRPIQRSFPNNVATTYSYDLKGQLLNMLHKKSDGALLDGFAYEYDANGNRTSMTDNLGKHAYAYDKLDRLTQVKEPFGLTQDYQYDPVGNRTRLTKAQKYPTSPLPSGQAPSVTETIDYTYDLADRLLSAGATDYTFDAVGRLAQLRAPPNAPTVFEYDPFDRPKKISGLRHHLSGEALPDSLYAYAPQLPDLRFTPAPLGVRSKKTDSRGVTQYLVDNTGNVAAELDQNAAFRRTYTHTPNLDDPLAITDEQGQTYFMLQDGLGSVRMLTDQEGDPAQLYTYDAFGKPNVTEHDKNALKFTAREYDADAQLQYNRTRYFDSSIARWTTTDPLSLVTTPNFYKVRVEIPQQFSRCAYAANNPITNNDPTGLVAIPGIPSYGAYQLPKLGTFIGAKPKTECDTKDIEVGMTVYRVFGGLRATQFGRFWTDKDPFLGYALEDTVVGPRTRYRIEAGLPDPPQNTGEKYISGMLRDTKNLIRTTASKIYPWHRGGWSQIEIPNAGQRITITKPPIEVHNPYPF